MKTHNIIRIIRNIKPGIIVICSLIIFISSCNLLESRKWNNLKKSGALYKKDTIDKFFHTVLDDSETVWLNKSYYNFPYKENCNQSIKVTCNLSHSVILSLISEDSLSIANKLVTDIQKKGFAIFAGQTIDKVNLVIQIYTDKEATAFEILHDFGIPIKAEILDDNEWKYYLNLVHKNKVWQKELEVN